MRRPRGAVADYIDSAFPGARVEPLAGDASARCFFRLHLPGGTSRVLMDYGRSFEGETDDMRVTRLFREASLPVAEIVAAAGEPGCLVLEDLGSLTLERALADAARDRRNLYGRAVELLVAIATRGTSVLERSERARQPALDSERFRFEMDFYLEHFAGSLMGNRELPRELPGLLHALADRAAETPRDLLCHRDFHSRNLLVRDDGSLVMVDIQDARRGPDTYDVASLLRDAYVDLDEAEVERLLESYRGGLPDPPEPDSFRARFHIVAAQRMIKALGTFGYQVASLGRHRYREPISRTVRRLRRLLPASPETAPLTAPLQTARLL